MADSVKIRIDGDTSGYEKSLNNLQGLTKSALSLVTGALVAGGAALVGFGAIGIKYNIDMETYTTNFEVMLGSQEKAIAKVEELKEFAAKTPFEMTDLANATKTLLAFGVANEDTMGIMSMLGDISLGNAEKLNSLSRAFGKMTASQKVSLEDINIMIDAGFNPLILVAEKTGESMTDLYKRVSSGKVGINEIEEAFKTATSEGGQFYQGMQKASESTAGLISTLKDNALAKLGEAFQIVNEKLKEALPSAIVFVENLNMKPIVDGFFGLIDIIVILMPLIAGLTTAFIGFQTVAVVTGIIVGFQKAQLALQLFTMQAGGASLAQGILNGTLGIGEAIVAILTGKISIATLAQNAWNLAMKANPIGLIVTIIATLIVVIGTLMATNKDFRKTFMDVFKAIEDGLAFIGELFINMISWLKNNWVKIVEYLNAPFIAFNKYLIETGKKIKDWIADKIKAFKDKVEEFKDIGKNIVEGLWEGITSMDDWLIGKIKGLAKGIADEFKDFFGIASPSKLFMTFGGYLGEGLGQGIEKSTDNVVSIAEKQAKEVSEAYDFDIPSFKSTLNNVKSGIRGVADRVAITKANPQATTSSNSTQVDGDNFYITVDTDNIKELNDLIRIAENAKRMGRMGTVNG